MTPEQKAAYINAQTAAMLAELEGMKVTNRGSVDRGETEPFGAIDFDHLINKYGLHHNAVVLFFQE